MEDKKKNVIGKNIKYLREKNSLTQIQLADKLNTSKQTISNWEVGRKVPRMKYIELLSELFGVKKSAIIEDQDEDFSPSGKDKGTPNEADLNSPVLALDGKPITGDLAQEIRDYARFRRAQAEKDGHLKKVDKDE